MWAHLNNNFFLKKKRGGGKTPHFKIKVVIHITVWTAIKVHGLHLLIVGYALISARP